MQSVKVVYKLNLKFHKLIFLFQILLPYIFAQFFYSCCLNLDYRYDTALIFHAIRTLPVWRTAYVTCPSVAHLIGKILICIPYSFTVLVRSTG